MTILAIGAEQARATERRMRRGWQRLRPLGRVAVQLSGCAVDVFWGLVEAYGNHSVASGTGDRLDQRKAEDRARNASDVVAPRALATGLQRLGHENLRPRNLASFQARVKFQNAPLRRVANDGWALAAPQVIELGPEDEVRF